MDAQRKNYLLKLALGPTGSSIAAPASGGRVSGVIHPPTASAPRAPRVVTPRTMTLGAQPQMQSKMGSAREFGAMMAR